MKNMLLKAPPPILCENQVEILGLPIGSMLSVELSNPLVENYPEEIGSITLSADGYTLKIDSEDGEITEAYEYLQERVSAGYTVRFALLSDEPTWYVWGSKPWHWGKTKEGLEALVVYNPGYRLDLN
jgi:hypothetical protein